MFEEDGISQETVKELREVGACDRQHFLPTAIQEIFLLSLLPSFSHVHHSCITMIEFLYHIIAFLYLLLWQRGGAFLPKRGLSWISGGQPHPLIFKTRSTLPRFHFLGRRKVKFQSSHTTNTSFVTSRTRISINTRFSEVKSFHWNKTRHAVFFSIEGKAEADKNHSYGRTNAVPSALPRFHGILHPSLLLPNP